MPKQEGMDMRRLSTALAVIGLTLCSSPLLAQTASSSGNALSLNLTANPPLAPAVIVNVAPVAATSGTAPPSYDVSNSVASVNQGAQLSTFPLGISENLSTGLLSSNSSGTSTGAQATATIDNASFAIDASGFLNSLFNLNATTISSTSQASSNGGLSATGSTTIEGLTFGGTALSSIVLNGSAFVNPAPNTVLINVGGLSIVLNEQIQSGDGVSGIGITTNAIHASLSGFPLGTNLANGDLILGHSQAFATVGTVGAVPEPATWAMMLVGFGAAGFSLRRRRAQASSLAMA